MPTDAELLHRYVRENDERAFAELVQRQLGLVYAAALRRTGGRAHLAEEIAQKVFADLARKAPQLTHHPTLTGWLYRSTRYAAIDAARDELRRQRLNQTLASMPEHSPSSDAPVEWERLRPVLDAAMDQLKDSDREAMLLRFFNDLSFAEVGDRLNLSENAARMRTERALEKLRIRLGRRGVNSTTAALGLLLVNQAFAAAPEGLASQVSSTALAAVPAAGGAGWPPLIFTGKFVAPAVGALGAAGVTLLAWGLAVDGVDGPELAALRAERIRLTEVVQGGIEQTLVAAANEFSATAVAVFKQMQAIHPAHTDVPGGRSTAGGYRYRGQATPRDAYLSFAWASAARDVPALARLMTFDERSRETARSIHASMPEPVRVQYPTPEQLFAFFFATDTLLSPVPPAKFVESFVAVELAPDRFALRPADATSGGLEFQLTSDGWKHVAPEPYLGVLASRIMSNEVLKKLNAP